MSVFDKCEVCGGNENIDGNDECRCLLEGEGMSEGKMEEALKYCEPYIDQMWASRIVGILLGCDFKDSEHALRKYKERKK